MADFKLDKTKAENALLYIGSKIQSDNVADKYKLLKILYFAERKHLAKYGRPITGDKYVKMGYGPVPTFCLDLVKRKNKRCSMYERTKKEIVINKSPNLDYLSESDIECMDEAIAEISKLGFAAIKTKSHDSLHKGAVNKSFLSFVEMAKAEGADDSMISYIKLESENQNFTFNAPKPGIVSNQKSL